MYNKFFFAGRYFLLAYNHCVHYALRLFKTNLFRPNMLYGPSLVLSYPMLFRKTLYRYFYCFVLLLLLLQLSHCCCFCYFLLFLLPL